MVDIFGRNIDLPIRTANSGIPIVVIIFVIFFVIRQTLETIGGIGSFAGIVDVLGYAGGEGRIDDITLKCGVTTNITGERFPR